MSGLGVVAALGFAGIMLNNRGGSHLSPADSSGDDSLVTQTSAETRTSDSAESLPQTSLPTGTNVVSPTTRPTGPTNTAATVPGQNGGAATTAPVVVPPITNSPEPTTTYAQPPDIDETKTDVSKGGTITVRLRAGVLTLLDQMTNSGYTSQVENNEATRIRVRFDTSNGYSRIEVTIGSDGHMLVDASENYSGGGG